MQSFSASVRLELTPTARLHPCRLLFSPDRGGGETFACLAPFSPPIAEKDAQIVATHNCGGPRRAARLINHQDGPLPVGARSACRCRSAEVRSSRRTRMFASRLGGELLRKSDPQAPPRSHPGSFSFFHSPSATRYYWSLHESQEAARYPLRRDVYTFYFSENGLKRNRDSGAQKRTANNPQFDLKRSQNQ